MVGQSIGYWTAWGKWWTGEDIRMMSLHGFRFIWVARIAKGITFAGGLTVILDIVGSDRAEAAALGVRGIAKRNSDRFWRIFTLFGVVAALLAAFALLGVEPADQESPGLSIPDILLLVVFLGLSVFGVLLMVPVFLYLGAALLATRRRQIALRVVSVVLIIIGFHFDLLTS